MPARLHNEFQDYKGFVETLFQKEKKLIIYELSLTNSYLIFLDGCELQVTELRVRQTSDSGAYLYLSYFEIK